MNAWVDASLTRTPDTWGQVASGGQHGGRAEYMHPLLDEHGAELDYYTRHPRILPTVRQLLGGDDACFTQFDFRQSPGGLELRNDLHHDVGSARTSVAETIAARPYGRHDTLCSIVYLTDVHEASPAFAVVPGSHRVPVWPKPGAPQRDAETDAVLCASPALSPLPLIFSYNSEKSLWGQVRRHDGSRWSRRVSHGFGGAAAARGARRRRHRGCPLARSRGICSAVRRQPFSRKVGRW